MIIFDKIKSLFTQNKIPAEQQTTYSEQVENNLMIRLELAQKTIALEKSLDRVRVCALKMNTTDELATVVETLLVELEGLNLGLLRVGIAILNKNLRTTKTWSSFLSDEKRRVKLSGEYSVDIHKVLANAFDKWAKGLDDVYFYTIEPDELKAYYAALNKVNFNLSSQNQTAEETAIKRQYYVGIYFKEGGLFAFSNKPYENYTIELLKRFTEVIGLTYARFNEIKVAENSAKKVTTLLTEIRDSINYAKRIQQTLLAQDDFLRDNLNELFVFFVPKDIVSGDFYWATKQNKKFYLAVCDSTGHGVPGAFMSLLNIGFLNEAINEKAIEKPNEVFDYVRLKLINTISKDDQKDGFDGILLCFDEENKSITYAAANNSPLLIRDGVISEIGRAHV